MFGLIQTHLQEQGCQGLNAISASASCESMILENNATEPVTTLYFVTMVPWLTWHDDVDGLSWLGLTHGTYQWHIPPWRDLFWGRMDDWSQSGCRKTALYVQWVCCYHTCQCGDPVCCCPISPWIGEYSWHEGSLCTRKTIKGNHLVTLFKCKLKEQDHFSWSRKVYWIKLYTDWEVWESVSCDIFAFKEDF